MGNTISIDELAAIAEKFQRDMRNDGGFPRRRRLLPRSEEKQTALVKAAVNYTVKFGLRRYPDGTYRLPPLA